MQRSKEKDNDDLVAFVQAGAHRVGQSIDVPSPNGRNQAGWTTVGIKLQPEAVVMLDQLREHPYFRGVWKTQAQVAWSMVYLGLQSVRNFMQDDWVGWKKFKSNAVVMSNAAMEHHRLQREEALSKAAQLYRRTIHGWLDRGDEFGKYMAWKTLESALESRNICEDVRKFDEIMRNPERGTAIGASLVFDNRAGDMYRLLVPTLGGPVDEGAKSVMYAEMTSEYFIQLDHERSAAGGDDEF